MSFTFTVMSAGSQAESSAAEPKKIRVLIADDHVIVLEGLAAIIGRQPDMVVAAQAANGQEAVELWSFKCCHQRHQRCWPNCVSSG
jgi:hypothetical protein